MADGIDFAVSDGIARITLARPDVGNAIDLAVGVICGLGAHGYELALAHAVKQLAARS